MIIRWTCENCSKRWIYPVEKCIYCKGITTKQKGSKLKIAGITKVFIPSPMHPIIPYNIILLQDEFGKRMPKKTMRDYKIGDIYSEQKAKTGNAVAVIKVKYDIYEAIKEAIELLNGFELDTKDKILVKPSIITAAYPYQAVNTNPDFIDALLRVLFDMGLKKENIITAEQALIGADAKDAASKSGILEVCKKHGVEFVDISKGPFEETESDGYKFKIFKEALKRKVINVPIMKTNFKIGLSGAVENLSRLVDEQTQRDMYYEGIEETLPKLSKSLLGVFTIADATNGMQGQGPLALGEPAFLKMIYASKNSAALDTIFCKATMMPVPNYVASALSIDTTTIEVVGNDLEALMYQIKTPSLDETPHSDIKVINGKACPACLNLMYGLALRLVGFRGQQINVIVGSVITKEMFEGKERLVAIGDCAIKKLKEMKIDYIPGIDEKTDQVEQIVLLKKLLETKGVPKITNVDKVKSKIKKILSKVG